MARAFKTLDIRSLFFGTLLGAAIMFCLGAATTGSSPAAWEYKLVPGNVLEGQLEKALNSNAVQGWEFVSATPLAEHWAFAVLKRERK